MRTARYTLTTEPIRVDVSPNDNVSGQAVMVIPQAAGTIVVCEDANGYANGARIPLSAGQPISFDSEGSGVWLASAEDLAVDTIETGVS